MDINNDLNNCDHRVSASLVVMCNDFQSVSRVLDVEPTRVILKGEKTSSVLHASDTDVWIYSGKTIEESCIDGSSIISLLDSCKLDNEKVEKLNAIGHCVIRVSVVSDYAQISMLLSKGLLNRIASVGIDLEFSVLSWGGVVDDR